MEKIIKLWTNDKVLLTVWLIAIGMISLVYTSSFSLPVGDEIKLNLFSSLVKILGYLLIFVISLAFTFFYQAKKNNNSKSNIKKVENLKQLTPVSLGIMFYFLVCENKNISTKNIKKFFTELNSGLSSASSIEIQHGIDKLQEQNFLKSTIDDWREIKYCLSAEGRNFLAENKVFDLMKK